MCSSDLTIFKVFIEFVTMLLLLYVLVFLAKRPAGGFPDGAVVENLPANAGDTGSSPGLGRSHMPWSN